MIVSSTCRCRIDGIALSGSPVHSILRRFEEKQGLLQGKITAVTNSGAGSAASRDSAHDSAANFFQFTAASASLTCLLSVCAGNRKNCDEKFVMDAEKKRE